MDLRRGTLGTMAAVALVAVIAVGCGSSGPDASSRSVRVPAAADGSASGPTSSSAPGSDVRTVSYRGVQFDVPADWPVYDLESTPTTCVRYDVHAVYLGHAGTDMQCPAHLSGRTDTVQIEPTDGVGTPSTDGGATAEDVNGLSVTVAPDAADGQLAVDVPDAGVVATFTFTSSDVTARTIVGTLRKAGG